MGNISDLFWSIKIIREIPGLQNESLKITFEDLQPHLSDVFEIDPTQIQHLLIDVKRDENRINDSDLKHPIILVFEGDDPILIADGQHRTVKALRSGLKISAKKLDLNTAPHIFRSFFGKRRRA